MMRLTTIGRRSGRERSAILGYFEDGPNLVTMAMNGWADPDPGQQFLTDRSIQNLGDLVRLHGDSSRCRSRSIQPDRSVWPAGSW